MLRAFDRPVQATELVPEMKPGTTEQVVDGENTSAENQARAGETGQEDVETLRQEADDYRDRYLRAIAEMDNYKKRVEQRYADKAEAERRRLLRAFLTVADNLERALIHADADGSLAEGVQLTFQDLQQLLRQEGVEPIMAVGQPFDPQVHEAVAVVPGDDGQAVVVDETQRGYLYQGELLRPAKVIVSQPEGFLLTAEAVENAKKIRSSFSGLTV